MFYLKKEPESELVETLNDIVKSFDVKFYNDESKKDASNGLHDQIVYELEKELVENDRYDLVDSNITFRQPVKRDDKVYIQELGEFDVAGFEHLNGNGILHVYEVKSSAKKDNREKGELQLDRAIGNVANYFYGFHTYLKLGALKVEKYKKSEGEIIHLPD
ncbi:MAG: hypothetical protein ABEK17_01985 [Candidatus Aenigmatarchaeota archaeon]